MGDNTYREYLHQVADSVHSIIVRKFGIPSLSDRDAENDLKKPKLSQEHCSNDLRNSLVSNPSHAIPIEDANAISLMDFKKKYFNTHTPCLLKNASKNWEAYRKWSDVNYLLEKAAYRAVPVEIGQYYTSEDWSQKIMPFHQYVKEYVMEGNTQIGYLAQHPLFEQIHSLRKDIQEPIYCMLGELGEMSGVNAWYGPKGTISPLHTDPCDNILVQLVGHKFVRIYHPDETPHLYKRQSGILQANTSEIDNLHLLQFEEEERKILNEKFPLISKATHYWDCTLCEGDMLFIPKLYWHYVQSLSISFSISYWFV
ncbi:predicted protein [Naegleria gruberi]|uniref:Predicted protein n=1 Tax=Naegleria gruberi TaxID=5762 RepID=D2VHH6_NAEGR|nr:uncharacterized protein NAEGRDRAFT_68331 [Naegleria gruberi]EFC43682.1 predicted protein [Naegleria gruberi]|eukprot:XP_002676426.1 predicted protein [Naegleria gruberi strain NEG-M]